MLIVGEGEEGESLVQMSRLLDLSPFVTFPGAQRHDELVRFYRACDVFINPSERTDLRFNTTAAEAMACGKGGDHPKTWRTTELHPGRVERSSHPSQFQASPGRADQPRSLKRDCRAKMEPAARQTIVQKLSQTEAGHGTNSTEE